MKNKLKTKARKLRTKKELKEKTPIFQTEGWLLVKASKESKVKNRVEKNRIRKEEREATGKKKIKLTKKRLKKAEKNKRKLEKKKAKKLKYNKK